MSRFSAPLAVDQEQRQIEAVENMAPINGANVYGSDGSRTPPQVFMIASPMDGELPRPATVGNDFYKKAREMRRDPTIRMMRELSIAPILMAEWEYTASPDAPPGAMELVKGIMEEMRLRLLRTSLMGMCDYGWQPYEVIADVRTDGSNGLRLKPLLQDITSILVDAADGGFFGLRQTPMSGLRIGFIYLLQKYHECFVVSQDVEGTNWYGEPTLRSIEQIYDEAKLINKAARKYDAKVAGTHWVIYYPLGNSKYEGIDQDNGDIARKLLEVAESVGGIIVPRSVIQAMDALNAAAAAQEASQWKIELLSDKGAGQMAFENRLKYLDTLKVRAFGFPERAVLEGQFGTKAEAEAHADIAVASVEVKHALIVQQYNEKLVDDCIIEWNYGKEMRGCVRITPSPLADEKKAFFESIYTALLTNPQSFMTEISALDVHQIRERLGLPELAHDESTLQAFDPYGMQWDPYQEQTMPMSLAHFDPGQPREPAGSPEGGEWDGHGGGGGGKGKGNGKPKGKAKKGEGGGDFAGKWAETQTSYLKKRNEELAKKYQQTEVKPQGPHKSDLRVAFNTPTEQALTKKNNFQFGGILNMPGQEGTITQKAVFTHPSLPGSILVNQDGSWLHFNNGQYEASGANETDLKAFLRQAAGEIRQRRVSMSYVDDAADETEDDPTEAQRKAGNYRKGRVSVHGLPISIETARGNERHGNKQPAHYGYIRGVTGADGDQVDVFIGKHPESELAFVANMQDDDGEFDEHKVLIGYRSRKKAIKALIKAYGGNKRFSSLKEMTLPQLKKWLAPGAVTRALS